MVWPIGGGGGSSGNVLVSNQPPFIFDSNGALIMNPGRLDPLLDGVNTTRGPLATGAVQIKSTTAVVASATVPVAQNLYTVTTGKTLYLTDLLIGFSAATAMTFTLADNGTVFLTFNIAATYPMQMPFTQPLIFLSTHIISVNIPIATANNLNINMYGFEV